jgi:hypothetical protein
MPKARPVYVEIRIRAEIETLWRHTQTPELHDRWDLRFTEISYLPRVDPSEPQRFLYATRIGLGIRIEGKGESVGENDGASGRTSVLRFWSDDAKSLITQGSGYWKYVPTEDGIRFLTRYDYQTRFGILGRWVDRLFFRPLLGWATAWSFDRMRLWIEHGLDPKSSLERAAIHAAARLGLAMIWIYQGLVPKLLFTGTSGELETIRSLGAPAGWERGIIMGAGIAEISFGLAMLVWWRTRALFLLNIAALILLTLSVIPIGGAIFTREFNPAALNMAMIALAACGWIAARDELPSARRCLRRPPEGSP